MVQVSARHPLRSPKHPRAGDREMHAGANGAIVHRPQGAIAELGPWKDTLNHSDESQASVKERETRAPKLHH